jgi:predicted enzyme related to lactoylglutathione lyase
MWHFFRSDIMQAKINWFEIPATDLDRAAKFYEAVFDTKLRRENFSIDRTLARVEPAGGKVQKEKIELPQGIGFIAYFIDTEGNRVAMHGAA